MRIGRAMIVSGALFALTYGPAAAQTAASPAPAPAASAAATAAPANDASGGDYDVFAYILSDAQRKTLDRDSRCHDARSLTDAFVASAGKQLQTGVDAMSALEKCAVMPRVGGDWGDFRDYTITAAAALAYRVGLSANEDRLLKRSVDDASHVSGFEAANATVSTFHVNDKFVEPDSNIGHGMGEGPAQSSMQYRGQTKVASAYSGTYGKIATDIARASNTKLQELGAAHAQSH